MQSWSETSHDPSKRSRRVSAAAVTVDAEVSVACSPPYAFRIQVHNIAIIVHGLIAQLVGDRVMCTGAPLNEVPMRCAWMPTHAN